MHALRFTFLSLSLSAVALLAQPLPAASIGFPGFLGYICFESDTFVHNTTPVCNCTGAPATVEICHAETVAITIGGTPVSVKTGHSSTSCASQTQDHGECLFWRYVFDCCYGFWSGWTCKLRETQLHTSTTDCEV